ncbi:MAG: hypothetical protein GW917_02715 [Bdellovibrionales bacterium]|nr:hypothetical protein [Bdellovibrionales bacterium]
MKTLAFGLFIALFSFSSLAMKLDVQSCEENQFSLSFNSVMTMKTYSNGAIKVFELDHIEPAAVPYGVVVTLDRGAELSEMESFCRYIPYLSWVSVKNAVSSYDPTTNTLKLKMPARQFNPDTSLFEEKTLTIQVVKGARTAEGTVLAELN